jgi:hypothetical protein
VKIRSSREKKYKELSSIDVLRTRNSIVAVEKEKRSKTRAGPGMQNDRTW